jgi:glutamate synthase domain-containing protein 3
MSLNNEYKLIEDQIKMSNEELHIEISDLEEKTNTLHENIKNVFQKSVEKLKREVKTKIMEDWESFPITKPQIKALLDMKNEVLCRFMLII